MTRRITMAIGVLAAALVAAVAGATSLVAPSDATISCAKYASPSGSDSAAGSITAPFRTVGHLVDSLSSGQTGCLRGGTYTEDVNVSQGGITLTAYPNEDAKLLGRLWIQQGADGVTVSGLILDGKNLADLPSPTINADNVKFLGNDVSNEHTEICFVLGSSWGRTQNTLIQHNRIHACGEQPSTNLDHGIYVEASDNAQILDNVIYDNTDRGIQLYPDAQGTVIRGNIIDRDGEGIIFSGAGGVASSNTVVDHNLITNSTIRSDVESWYPAGNPVGTNNVVKSNCLVRGADVAIDSSYGGFTTSGNVVVSDAMYVSPSTGDYRLKDGSPCETYISASTAPAGPNGEPPVSSTSTTPPPPSTGWTPVVGMRVKVTNTSSADYGKVGEITYVSNDGNRVLLLMDNVSPKAALVSDLGPAA